MLCSSVTYIAGFKYYIAGYKCHLHSRAGVLQAGFLYYLLSRIKLLQFWVQMLLVEMD